MRTFVLASKNPHKAQEIREILGPEFEILTQTQAGAGEITVVEDGTTFAENAAKKAETLAAAVGRPVIADDSGLCVDCLGGAPGIYSARYAGPEAKDWENLKKLLNAMEGVPESERTARFVCVIALAEPGKETRFFLGDCLGSIALAPRGEQGFGYDPVFVPEGSRYTMAELEPETKNRLSHRAAALQAFREALENGK